VPRRGLIDGGVDILLRKRAIQNLMAFGFIVKVSIDF
jgi:hypothetical protein